MFAPTALPATKRALVLHAGGMGDLVLAMQSIVSIRAALADRHVTLCCRREFATLLESWPCVFDRVIALAFDPYVVTPLSDEESPEIKAFIASILEDPPDTLLSLELAPTWLTPIVAGLIRPGTSLSQPFTLFTDAMFGAAHERLGIEPFAFTTYEGDETSEPARYAEFLTLLEIPETIATFVSTERGRNRALAFLEENGHDGKPLLACFPLANRNVPIKRWPMDNFAAAIEAVAREYRLAPLLLGDASELAELHLASEHLRARGIDALVFSGTADELQTTVALLDISTVFCGNDTGLAHIAGALGTPGVVLFGGGHWPRFRPWAPGTIGLVHPLPCFGCGWDCAFEKALCLQSIVAQDCAIEIGRAMHSRGLPPEVVEFHRRGESDLETIALASTAFNHAREDRARRYDAMIELQEAARKIELLRSELDALNVPASKTT